MRMPRHTYWWLAHALIAGSYAMTALASFLALRMFIRTLAEIERSGGGIGALSFGIWQATRLPFAAAWIAVIATLVAGVFVLAPLAERRADTAIVQRPAAFGLITALALGAGALPVVLFRRATAFVLDMVMPATAPHLDAATRAQVIMSHLLTAAVISAACFVVVTTLVFAIVRYARHATASPRLWVMTLLALTVSLALSASFVAGLRSSSQHFRDVALHGRAIE